VSAVCPHCHKFEWATSTEIVHADPLKKSKFYALNVAISAAMIVVGESFHRMAKLAHVSNFDIAERILCKAETFLFSI